MREVQDADSRPISRPRIVLGIMDREEFLTPDPGQSTEVKLILDVGLKCQASILSFPVQ
jgi:hypothetical protein